MPATPGDGTILFATHCGRGHRLNLTTGEVIWMVKWQEFMWCSTGGGILGPNGVFYVVANLWGNHAVRPDRIIWPDLAPCTATICEEGPGIILAYRVSDGKVLNKKRHQLMGMQYPAVGRIGKGSKSKLVLVASMGQNPALAHEIFSDGTFGPSWFPMWFKRALFKLQIRSWLIRRLLRIPILQGATIAMDAETLEEIWRFDDEPWDMYAGAGDEEGFFRRREEQNMPLNASNMTSKDRRNAIICGPDSWGIPVISGDGTVYATSGTNGNLYAINDEDGNGHIDASEFSVFRTGQAFLNAPALAPGLLAAAPCWGPMYVFKG
eukprot:gnl/TRDRNA2_/TRDRNA2_176193_c1_seq1.p1 gnl/TRDRNA2_/TRDRNA2_176193_c1~~gnl/TRDRNA2_/TRDRNA2_176193_c1_seq1.p1  ORF type:complete len:376 (-),score=44.40 gnl/TRDRNA2_/TRDRNA2_176193_c1_seq1:244-1209(-)